MNPMLRESAFHPGHNSSHFTVKHFMYIFCCNTWHMPLNATSEETFQSHCIGFHIKGKEEMGVSNPGLDHRKMVWSLMIRQGMSLVGKAIHEL
jgi:hypothetical protein